MKKSLLIMLMGFLFFNTTYAQKYFGKAYTPTQNIDEYYNIEDIEKNYTVMGTTELGQGFRSLEKVQKKIIDLARLKGADAVVFKMEEETVSNSTSNTGTVNNKKKDMTTFNSGSVTTDIKQKKVYATFIKYK